MQNKLDTNNGVNETRTKSDSLSPGRCLMAQQHEPGRNTVTAKKQKRKWTVPDNRIVMKCYFCSEPSRFGYGKRMYNLWEKRNMFAVSQQRLIDQKNQIIKNQWFSELELEKLKLCCEDKSSVLIEEIGCERNGVDRFVDEVPIEKDSFEMEAKDEEKILLNRLNEINKNNRTILPALRDIDKTKLYAAVKKIDDILGKIKVKSITETNDLIYCGAVLVTDMVGVKIGKTEIKKEPW